MDAKFDEIFGEWVYRQLLDLSVRIDVKKWSHALSYTGGVNPDDNKEAYEKKTELDDIGKPTHDVRNETSNVFGCRTFRRSG